MISLLSSSSALQPAQAVNCLRSIEKYSVCRARRSRPGAIRVLLIGEIADEYRTIKKALAEISSYQVILNWAPTHQLGLKKIQDPEYDMVLLDYQPGGEGGLDLFRRQTLLKSICTPVVILTGQEPCEADMRAMEAWAADYLVKRDISADTLHRSICSCIEGKLTEREPIWANVWLRRESEERKNTEKALRLNESRLESLLAVSRMSGSPADRIADFVLEEQVKHTGSETGWLAFIDEEQTHLTFHQQSNGNIAQHSADGEQALISLELTGIWADTVKEGKTLVINDHSAEDSCELKFPGGCAPFRRLLATPVFEENRVKAVALVVNKPENYDTADVKYHTLLLDGMWKLIQSEQTRNTLAHLENLATLGRALSYVAHDMKTPLTAIGGFANLVRNRMAETNPDRGKLKIVTGEIRRLEAMIRNMLDFSRSIHVDRTLVDVEEMVGESLFLLDLEAKKRGLSVKSAMEHNLPRASIDPFRIKQVLINLVSNAIHSSPEGETVIISVRANQSDLIFDVTDQGMGICPEKRKDIFKPFFTTKKSGTGLGLSIVKMIVEAHNGSIIMVDNPGGGLTFRVEIPDCLEGDRQK
ncbi:MAG: ATP-binding protein [Syntrophobacteraceae bacterium]|nr:ATP-binding protein [Syntrophobacteraceae bacterium]